MNHIPVILLVLLTGCCYVRTPDATVIDIGTGRRCVHVGGVVVTHSEISDTLRAVAPIAESISEGAVRGAIKP